MKRPDTEAFDIALTAVGLLAIAALVIVPIYAAPLVVGIEVLLLVGLLVGRLVLRV